MSGGTLNPELRLLWKPHPPPDVRLALTLLKYPSPAPPRQERHFRGTENTVLLGDVTPERRRGTGFVVLLCSLAGPTATAQAPSPLCRGGDRHSRRLTSAAPTHTSPALPSCDLQRPPGKTTSSFWLRGAPVTPAKVSGGAPPRPCLIPSPAAGVTSSSQASQGSSRPRLLCGKGRSPAQLLLASHPLPHSPARPAQQQWN